MTKTKTLMLAAIAALSLGAGGAMAQDGSGGGLDYLSRQNVIAAQGNAAFPIQSGSSDVERGTGADHSPAFILQHKLYGAGGVGG